MKTIMLMILVVAWSQVFSQPSAVNNTVRSEILKSLNLSSKEMGLLNHRRQMCFEIEQLKKDVNATKIELLKLYKIEKISREFTGLNSKVLRKIERYSSYELSLRFDIAECLDMQNDILYHIYKNHYILPDHANIPSYGIVASENDKKDAELIYNEALNMREIAYSEINEEKCYEKLMNSIKNKSVAIAKQEILFASWFNIPYKIDSSTLLNEIAINSNIPSETIIENNEDEIQLTSEQKDIINKSEENKVAEVEKSENIIYKIQVGAFLNPVNVNEFHGLSPISVDKTDDITFTKFMVGEYKSIKAAKEAHKIIVNTTRYDDAFIVAYNQNKRVAIINLPEEKIQYSGSGNLVTIP
ncbi:MAG: hypothetical protein ABIJ97_12170 [Bacteroidota bacterium]